MGVENMKAVIQAGGKGTRLRPYTLVLPKPLMPVGGVPVIEILIKWLRRNGTREAYITTGHLGHLIRALCGDGSQWAVDIKYTEEPEPLGTVGALTLLKDELDQPFLMLNGDLITDLNLNDFTSFHKSHDGLLTIGVTKKKVKIDLGTLEMENQIVKAFVEKPVLQYDVSMGIYCMEPEIINLIPKGVPFGFDDLMHSMLGRKLPVYAYQHEGMWLDIGRPEDFQKAQEYFKETEINMLGI